MAHARLTGDSSVSFILLVEAGLAAFHATHGHLGEAAKKCEAARLSMGLHSVLHRDLPDAFSVCSHPLDHLTPTEKATLLVQSQMDGCFTPCVEERLTDLVADALDLKSGPSARAIAKSARNMALHFEHLHFMDPTLDPAASFTLDGILIPGKLQPSSPGASPSLWPPRQYAVLLSSALSPYPETSGSSDGTLLALDLSFGSHTAFEAHFLDWIDRQGACLAALGVGLVISAAPLSATISGALRARGLAVVAGVDEASCRFLADVCGVCMCEGYAVDEVRTDDHHLIKLAQFSSAKVGSEDHVLLRPEISANAKDREPCALRSLVLGVASKPLFSVYGEALLAALKSVAGSLDGETLAVCPGGGFLEFSVHHHLQSLESVLPEVRDARQFFADLCLTLPRRLISSAHPGKAGQRSFLHYWDKVSEMQAGGLAPFLAPRIDGRGFEVLSAMLLTPERPAVCTYALALPAQVLLYQHALETLIQIMRIDNVVSAARRIRDMQPLRTSGDDSDSEG